VLIYSEKVIQKKQLLNIRDKLLLQKKMQKFDTVKRRSSKDQTFSCSLEYKFV